MRRHRARGLAQSLTDPRAYSHLPRMLHFFNYTHVQERRKLNLGKGVRISPTVGFRNGERITVGDGSHLGEGCLIWAGNNTGRIVMGDHVLLGPDVIMTSSNYDFDAGSPVMDQPTIEQDIVIGADVWLGARVIVVAGVTIGEGCVVGAGSIVTKDLPPWSVAVGSPAKVVRERRRPGQEAGQGSTQPDPGLGS